MGEPLRGVPPAGSPAGRTRNDSDFANELIPRKKTTLYGTRLPYGGHDFTSAQRQSYPNSGDRSQNQTRFLF